MTRGSVSMLTWPRITTLCEQQLGVAETLPHVRARPHCTFMLSARARSRPPWECVLDFRPAESPKVFRGVDVRPADVERLGRRR
jgi:hypothetical protein